MLKPSRRATIRQRTRVVRVPEELSSAVKPKLRVVRASHLRAAMLKRNAPTSQDTGAARKQLHTALGEDPGGHLSSANIQYPAGSGISTSSRLPIRNVKGRSSELQGALLQRLADYGPPGLPTPGAAEGVY